MTDDPKKPDRILSSTEEEAVRRQLAAARHTGPMPADVAGRLDDVIAGLQAERAEAPASNVVSIASRRRHRIAQGIVAAAAVVAVGVGMTQLLGNVTSGRDDAGDASVSSESDHKPDSGGVEEQAPRAESPSGRDEMTNLDTYVFSTAPEVRSASFRRDVSRLTSRTSSSGESSSKALGGRRCGATSPPGGREALAVQYDGQPAVLVFGKPVDGRQRVDLYLCATGVRERSATIQQP